MPRHITKMRDYWDRRAQLNAAFYVDTSLAYDDPDMDRFLETGRRVVAIAMDEPPAVAPAGAGLAVEIGCGRICLALSERFAAVVGYDISAEMLERARELVGDERVQFRQTPGATLPDLADGSADLVLTFTVFQHIPAVSVIRSYVAEAARVLRPGGVFVLQWNGTPGAGRWRAQRAVRSMLGRLGRGDRYGRDAPQFLGSRIEVATMRRMLGDVGLELVATRGDGSLFTWGWARRTTPA